VGGLVRVLLDTHALLCAVGDVERLGAVAKAALRNPTNELVVSAATAFELSTKQRIGKLPDAATVLAAYTDVLRQLGAEELPITSHHALVAGQLAWDHRDPFDRILAAQAITEALPLVSSDRAFDTISGVRRIWD
jgi:PIN domain nuclease of toxin-antitoxin system